MTQPEALRLADELDQYLYSVPAHPLCTDAAAELRRLHAENERLATALASSCDEARDQIWESGGVAGCSRALSAEFQRDALLEALRQIVEQHGQWNNGIWAANIARAAIKAVKEGK